MTGTTASSAATIGATASASDRYIPSRSTVGMDASSMKLCQNSDGSQWEPENKYEGILAANMFGVENVEDHRILVLKAKAPTTDNVHLSDLNVLYSYNALQLKKTKVNRVIPSDPYRILDAPGFLNDYYHNNLDWSSENVVAIALDSDVHLWNATTGETVTLSLPEDTQICSLKFDSSGQHVAVGLSDGIVEIWNVERQKKLRALRGHESKVNALAWAGFVLSSGAKDAEIHNHDVRKAEHLISRLNGHQGAVCGLEWNHDHTLLASGGNDNILNIWEHTNFASRKAKYRITDHCAAVRAVAWCPWQRNLLASGGGTSDRSIKFWNASTGKMLDEIKTDSQICSLQWGVNEREIVSTHGYSRNNIAVWKYPSLSCIGDLTGHQERVLASSVSPDGSVLLTASPDETLRFWKLWNVKKCNAPTSGTADGTSVGDWKDAAVKARLR
eukprot:GHVL01023647.1.p1 GENE.GHVL01023647.1~~GHVL01023647.1.p1  ORF type:complete len:444 (-),score=69.32 GHVL01023647.1:266-1597(-)